MNFNFIFKGLVFSIKLLFFTAIIACNSEQTQNKINTKVTASSNAIINSNNADISFLENQLLHDSENIDLRIKIAANYYAMQNFERALFHLEFANKIDQKNQKVLINIGNIYYDTKKNEKAIEYYENALKSDNKNMNVRCDLATCYFNLKKSEKAITLLKENIKQNSNHAQTHYNLSVIYNSLGRKQEADEEINIFNKLKH